MSTVQSQPTLVVFVDSFPVDCRPEDCLSPDLVYREVHDIASLSAVENVTAVVLYSHVAVAGECLAVRFLERLRTSRNLPVVTRQSPVVVLGEASAESRLRADSAFLVLLSPGVEYVSAPFSHCQVRAALEKARCADLSQFARYMDVESRLVRLRHSARHGLANALGPHVLLSSGLSAGVLGRAEFERNEASWLQQTGRNTAAEEYADLMALQTGELEHTPVEAATRHAEVEGEIFRVSQRLLLLDDDHASGWPRALAAVLGLRETPPSRTDVPVCSYSRRGFRLDCWVGSDCTGDLPRLLGVDAAGYLLYDTVLLDLRLRRESAQTLTTDLSGFQALKQIYQADASVQVVLFSASQNARHMHEMMELGIAGYYAKEDSLSEPHDANVARLLRSLYTVSQNQYRREAHKSLTDAFVRAQARDWFGRGSQQACERFEHSIYHLQCLVLTTRDSYLSTVVGVQMQRHFIESAHAVLEAALRLRFPGERDRTIGEVVERLPRRGCEKHAARWLNDTRNRVVHEKLSTYQMDLGPETPLWAISAACLVASEGKCDGHQVVEQATGDRRVWPAWLEEPSKKRLQPGESVLCIVNECSRRGDGRIRSLLATTEETGDSIRVTDLQRVSTGDLERIREGSRLTARINSVKQGLPQATLEAVLE